MLKHWIRAFRLRTLPLSFSTILTGTFTAVFYGHFDSIILILALITVLFLQILSNLANDYGDGVKGTDNEGRIGPERTVQSGVISIENMKMAILVFASVSLLSGTALIYFSFGSTLVLKSLMFLVLGIGAILAAITYTVGKSAYGYAGLGDLFVFIFFGLVGVMGSFYLYAGGLIWQVILPAVTIGCFSAGVLNLNNMRDIENDREAGKNTLAVKLGPSMAKKYHYFLILTGWATALVFMILAVGGYTRFLFIFCIPLFVMHVVQVIKIKEPAGFDPELKKLALSTFIFSILWGISIVI